MAIRIPKQGLVICDAYFCYRESDGAHAFRFLEWDTGSMPVAQIGLKIDRYRELFGSKAWKTEYKVFPKVAMVLDGRRQEDRLKYLLREACHLAILYEGLDFLLTTEQELQRHGPFGWIWWWAQPGGGVLRGFIKRPDQV